MYYLKITYCFFLFVFCNSFVASFNKIKINKEEAEAAFQYLNQFRAAPIEMGKKVKIKLNGVASRQILLWDTILAKVAEEKALDMAKHNYFAHVNKKGQGINIMLQEAGYNLPEEYYSDPKANYFESICYGAENGIDGINVLIRDSGEPGLGHRKHLLGIDDKKGGEFNILLTDIGIGYVTVTKNNILVKSYMSVIIATHKKL